METISFSKADVLTDLNHPKVEEIHLKSPNTTLDKAVVRLSNKVLQENLKGKIKLGLSVLYFFSLVYFSIQLFI